MNGGQSPPYSASASLRLCLQYEMPGVRVHGAALTLTTPHPSLLPSRGEGEKQTGRLKARELKSVINDIKKNALSG